MSNEKYYKISEKRLIELLECELELNELECLGVDNWSGYNEVEWEYIDGEPGLIGFDYCEEDK